MFGDVTKIDASAKQKELIAMIEKWDLDATQPNDGQEITQVALSKLDSPPKVIKGKERKVSTIVSDETFWVSPDTTKPLKKSPRPQLRHAVSLAVLPKHLSSQASLQTVSDSKKSESSGNISEMIDMVENWDLNTSQPKEDQKITQAGMITPLQASSSSPKLKRALSDTALPSPTSSPKLQRAANINPIEPPLSPSPKSRRALSDSTPRKPFLNLDTYSCKPQTLDDTLSHLTPRRVPSPTGLSAKRWIKSQYLLSNLEIYAKDKFSQQITDSSTIIKYFIKEKLILILEIHSKINKSSIFSENSFLTELVLCYDALEFQKKIGNLKKKRRVEYECFVSIVGKEVLACLDLSLQKSTLEEWEKFIRDIQILNKFTNQVLSQKVTYPSDFDQKFPILKKTKKSDILDSFRKFTELSAEENHKTFYFNNEWIPRPIWSSLDKETNRKRYFIKWLIYNLNKSFGIVDEARAIHEAKIVCNEILTADEIDHLTQSLDSLVVKHENKMTWMNLPTISTELSLLIGKAHYAHNFILWLKENFEKLFMQEKKMSSHDIVFLYTHESWLKKCSSHVPCFRMVLLISINAYLPCEIILRESFCPEIMKMNSDLPHLQCFQYTDDTRWLIVADKEHQTFEITHIKPYRFIQGTNSAFEEWGTIKVHWKLSSHLCQTFFSPTVWFEDIYLSEEKPLEKRLKIIENLMVKVLPDQATRSGHSTPYISPR